ncbi:MAG: HAMP domain-containing sensor histidine kinase [Parvularcula sp.]|nr:HAMP domain-containing sensor histidine kinase [Parvularcula sp.]
MGTASAAAAASLGDPLILRQNLHGTILSAEGPARGLFGLSEDRLCGLRLTDLVAASEHSQLLKTMATAMQFGRASQTVTLRREASAPVADLVIETEPGSGFRSTLQAHGPVPSASPANDPLPAPRRADQLADVSHEIRTPLNAVIGFADALRQESFGPLGDRRYRDYAKMIQESGQHVLALVNDLLDLSAAEADRLPVKREETDLRELIESCAEMMQLEAERAGLKITCLTSPQLRSAEVDPKLVRQILLNLLSNALKFTHAGGITMRSRVLEGRLVVAVEDTGIGMSADDLAQLGERFHLARREGVRGVKGSGLGLALSQALAKAHGGRLTVTSRQGEGTTATLIIPLSQRRYEAAGWEPKGRPRGY